jgi:hypothetical protein
MTFDSNNHPIPRRLKCKCSIEEYWTIPPNLFFTEPSPEKQSDLETVQTTIKCNVCGQVNERYWYKTIHKKI